jgi:proteasome lid subunit RPN8/RPN11
VSEDPRRLVLARGALADLAAVVEAAGAEEACGALLGVARDGGVAVDRVVPLRNARGGRGGFSITDAELRRARRAAARCGLDVVGIYHSHPGGGIVPSAADRAGLARASVPWLVLARPAGGTGGPGLAIAAYAPGTGAPVLAEIAPGEPFRPGAGPSPASAGSGAPLLPVEGRSDVDACPLHGAQPAGKLPPNVGGSALTRRNS